MKLENWFNQKGYDLSAWQQMSPYIELWKQWHAGHVPRFHVYTMHDGRKKRFVQRRSISMANQICGDYADFLLNERVDYNIGDEELTKIIKDLVLDPNDFNLVSNKAVELTWALGTGAFVRSINNLVVDPTGFSTSTEDTNIIIDFVSAQGIIPLTYKGNNVSECAFISSATEDGDTMIYVALHLLNENATYRIENFKFIINQDKNLKRVYDDTIIKVFETKNKLPWFNIIRPNVTNTINLDSPYGISVFHKSIKQLEDLDTIYDSFVNEFKLGKKRLFIDTSVLKVNEKTGDPIFDDNDVLFYQLGGISYGESDSSPKSMITESNMTLRIGDHKEGIETSLNLISKNVGLGADYYSFEKGSLATATQVVSENSELYRSIKKQEIPIDNALHDLFLSILEMGETHKIGGITREVTIQNEDSTSETRLADVSIKFDDSIIEDEQAIYTRAMSEYSAGLTSEVQYFMDTRQLTRQQAVEYYNQMIEDKRIEVEVEME